MSTDIFAPPPPDPHRVKTPPCAVYKNGLPSLNEKHNCRCYLYANHACNHKCKCGKVWT